MLPHVITYNKTCENREDSYMKHGSLKSTAAIIKTRDDSSKDHMGHLSFPPLFKMGFFSTKICSPFKLKHTEEEPTDPNRSGSSKMRSRE